MMPTALGRGCYGHCASWKLQLWRGLRARVRKVALHFNEADFRERCEQAAVRLGFIGDRLAEPELEDLVNLAVNGEILDPASALGDHVNDCWPRSSAG